MAEKGMKCELKQTSIRVNNDLRISFQRTIRVPDNHQKSALPPDLGSFPLKPISRYAHMLPKDMAAKGGAFFPMYRKHVSFLSLAEIAYILQNLRRCGSTSTATIANRT